MAVANPNIPNLAGNYANIQNALTQSANLNLQKTGTLGSIAAAVTPIAEQTVKRSQDYFEAALQDNLNKNKAQYAAQAEGKELVTPDKTTGFEKQLGLEPGTMADIIPKEGIWVSPQEKIDLGTKLRRGQLAEDMASQSEAQGQTDKANLIRLIARSNDPQADQMLMRLKGFGQLKTRVNPATNTLEAYDPMNPTIAVPMGGILNTPDSQAQTYLFNDIPSIRRLDGKQATALETAAKTSATDPALKEKAKILDELNQVEKLVQANIPGSQINIGADTARAVGGVPGGKFSSLVAATEGKDPSLMGKLGQGYQTLTSGNMSKNNQELLLREIAVAKQQQTGELASTLDEKHKAIKRQAPYASDDLIASQLGYQRYLTENKPAQTTQPTIPTVKSQADYDALPSGAKYIAPNGKTLVKK